MSPKMVSSYTAIILELYEIIVRLETEDFYSDMPLPPSAR